MVLAAKGSHHPFIFYIIDPPGRGDSTQVFDHAKKCQEETDNRDGIRNTPHLVPLPYGVNYNEVDNDVIGKFHKGNKAGMQFNGIKARDNGKNKKEKENCCQE